MPASSKKDSIEALALRIVVLDPPPNISWALQLGQGELVEPTACTSARISFDFSVEVVSDSSGAFRLRGPAVQGRSGQRFVYLCMGAYAGQAGDAAGWRAKVSLEGIGRNLVQAANGKPAAVLEARIEGTAPDGGPSRASVQLLGEGWRIA